MRVISSVHTSRSGSRRSGSPWTTKVSLPTVIPKTWAGDLARPQLEHRGLGMDAGLAEANDRVRPPGDDAHRDRPAARRRVDCVHPEGGKCCVHRVLEHRHQVRLPLISTRGRVQIGSGLDCTCSINIGVAATRGSIRGAEARNGWTPRWPETNRQDALGSH
jgi:hypothetical protein